MGKSEEIIGMLLKETPEQDRSKVILATKCMSHRITFFLPMVL